MCEKCGRQTTAGTCTQPKARHFLKLCPGAEYGADIRECDFAEILPCSDKCNPCIPDDGNDCELCHPQPAGKESKRRTLK